MRPHTKLALFAITLGPLFAFCANSAAIEPVLTLEEAERLALGASYRLAASTAESNAASAQADAQYGTLFPKLGIDGTYRYFATIPELQVGPVTQRFGAHSNYSIGPTLSYTLWDGMVSKNLYRSAESADNAKSHEKANSELQVRLQSRVAYTQAQLAKQELDLVRESLSLARSQSRDIENRFRAGSASRLDFLSSQREITQYQLREHQSSADWKLSSAELAALIPQVRANASEPRLEDLHIVANRRSGGIPDDQGPDHPQILTQWHQSEALRHSAAAQQGGFWPMLQLQGRMSLDYPNGPTPEQIQQNSFQANLSWNLFEGGRTKALLAQKEAESSAMAARLEQTKMELWKDRQKARARLDSLAEQRRVSQAAIEQSAELARLNFEAHRAGRIALFEVHSSNLRLLEARIQHARIVAQLLIQHYTLEFLAGSSKESVKETL